MIKRIETIAFEECSHDPPCHHIDYPTEKRFINQEDEIILGINPDDFTQTCNVSELQGFDQCTVVSFSTQVVETISTELNYDGQSLVGEGGGVWGLFLGLSILSILEYILIHMIEIACVSMKPKMWVNLILKFLMLLSFVVFVYFSMIGFLKYSREPTSTQVSFVKSDVITEFPYITFCCLEKEDGNIRSRISNPYIRDCEGKLMYLNNENSWSSTYHKTYNDCVTFDLRKEKDLVIEEGSLTFGCELKTINGVIILHDEDSFISNGDYSTILVDSTFKNSHETLQTPNYWLNKNYVIRKTKYSSVSTFEEPCNTINAKISESSFEKTLPCLYSKYSLRSREETFNNDFLEITMDQTIVVQKTFIEYNAINLTGEVGGTLGMGLGWSVFFFWELLVGLVTKDRTRRMKLNWFGFMTLFLIFIYWSSGAVMDFHYESESMELNLEGKMFPPHITICKVEFEDIYGGSMGWTQLRRINSFMKWFKDTHPCSGNYPDYKNSLRSCLEQSQHHVVDSLMEYSDNDELPTPILLSLNNSTTLARSLWTKVFHEKHGVCYTLDAKNWER